MNIGRFAIRRKILIVMLFVGLTMLGYISYRNLPVELIPNAELPFLTVSVSTRNNVDPRYMESEAIIPIEGAIGTLNGVEKIESFANQYMGIIWIYYEQNANIKHDYLKLQEKVNAVKSSLPEEFTVRVQKIDTESFTDQFMGLQVLGSGGLDRVRHIVDRDIKGKLESIDGVAGVEVIGGREKSVEILIDSETCKAYGVTTAQISNLIRQSGSSNTFVGKVAGAEREYFVNVITEYEEIGSLENITVREEGPVLLKDIAEINFGVKEQTSISRVNGKDAVTVRLSRDNLVNLIELSDAVIEMIERINEELNSRDIEISVQFDAAETLRNNIGLIKRLALTGAILAIAVLWIFLRNLKLVLVVAAAIPISVFTAFNFFYASGITINTLTLVGVALAVGMLLDNSVVVLENIYRLVSSGKNADEAIVQGVGEVWRSVTAATLTTVVVFVPFLFAKSFMVRLIGKHVGVSIISTLLVSLIVALLLIPMVTHVFIKRRGRTGARFQVVSSKNRLVEIYTVLLKSALRFPVRTIIAVLVVFFASLIICLGLSLNVTQEAEESYFKLHVTMPPGSTLETTDAAVTEIESLVGEIPEVHERTTEIEEEDAEITFNLTKDYQKIQERSMADVKEEVRKRTKDFRAASINFDEPTSSRRYRRGGGGMERSMLRMFGIGSQQERVVIKGNDFSRMRIAAEDIRYHLENLTSVDRANLNISENSPEVNVLFDTQLLRLYNISAMAIMSELFSFQPQTEVNARFNQGVDEYPIVIRTDAEEAEREKTMDDLKALEVRGGEGTMHEMQELGRIVYAYGMPGIRRVNQEKEIEVTYAFHKEVNDSKNLLDTARMEVDNIVAGLSIPSGVAVEAVHDETDYSEYLFLIFVAFILIYMILASVFESLHTPVVMMFTIPLAAVGSLWALIATKTPIGPYSLIGMLILLGVVVNNGIILIDFALILRRRGFRPMRALMAAGRARVRPILITAITTIFAMIPLAMGKGQEATIIGAPFAIAVIGGLSVSTLFTLIFIPTVYSYLENALIWWKGLDRRLQGAQLLLLAVVVWLIYTRIDSTIWRLIYFTSAVKLIPGLTYLAQTSLRRARADYIADGEEIVISLRSIVKIYDWGSRFAREWTKGQRARERDPAPVSAARTIDYDRLIWQLPLLGFIVYFVYFYLTSHFWQFVFAHAVFFYIIFVWKPVRAYLLIRAREAGRSRTERSLRIAEWILLWGFPAFNLAFYLLTWDTTVVIVFIGIVWYLSLAIFAVSSRLHRERINVDRITGRFGGLRRAIYRIVLATPLIGRQRKPFRALAGVSLEIGRGMFGLLGPNGAGKTTLMRIICGIIEQSYGRVWINGVDANEHREELQGLIGYLPQEFGTYENMTAWEFLNYQAMLQGISDRAEREQRVDYVLRAVHIEEDKDRKIGAFSGGMKQRVGIAQILLHLPRILVVDEPTAGLDPRERIRFRNLLVELSRERVVIFSTHIIEDISSSCNRVAVLNKGELCYLGEPVGMTEIAENVVWQFLIDPKEFEELRKRVLVVHHMRVGEQIRVRCLSAEQPREDAQQVRPMLEDAYIWVMRQVEGAHASG